MKIYDGPVSPVKLSRIFKSESFKKGLVMKYVRTAEWKHLIGNLITCPLCGKRAVIVDTFVSLPIKKTIDIPCICYIDLDTCYIDSHWCCGDQRFRKMRSPKDIIYWAGDIDVCKPFKWFIDNSCRI